MKAGITLKELLVDETEATYAITARLIQQVTDHDLSWKPATGHNWMTMGQLLMHCSSFSCGKAIQGFVRGDWGMAEEIESEKGIANQHVPPPSALPTVTSVEQALKLLAEDRNLALTCINEIKESELLTKKLTAPWGGPERSLFQHLLQMIAHLIQHKGQLFYYLKLKGHDLNTSDLWGV